MAQNKKLNESDLMDKIVSLCKRRGFIFPGSEIYGGLAGFYTYGPLGKLLKNKVENSVRKTFNSYNFREIEGTTILPDIVWKASGHLETFKDRIIRCSKCKSAFRADKLVEENTKTSADHLSDAKILDIVQKNKIKCPSCNSSFEDKIEKQSLMMKTIVANQDASLRPETATVTYLPFLNYYNYFRKKLPFGVFQIGKVYRNEISPRQHVLRLREFTQAEGQIFIDPNEKNNWPFYDQIKKLSLPFWPYKEQEKKSKPSSIAIEQALKNNIIKNKAYAWCIWLAYTQFINFGIPKEKIRLRQHHPTEKSFYAEDAWDIEVELNNYGWTEVCGVHDRTDYDLKQHAKFSKTKLEAQRENNESFVPHILEIAFGTDRPTYALIDLFYDKKSLKEGKTTFRIPCHMAPIDISVFPLMKKPELSSLAKKIKDSLEKDFIIEYDESGSIGRRYLRSAIAGTPYAITIDYLSLENNDVTLRDRDTEKQIRLPIKDLKSTLQKLLNSEISFEKAGKLLK